MNYPALIFGLLSTSWRREPADEAVEALAADFAARVAEAKSFVCVALVPGEEVSGLYSLARVLRPFGVSLYRRYRDHDDRVYIFAQRDEAPLAAEAALQEEPYREELAA
jgi:hypothetical protein